MQLRNPKTRDIDSYIDAELYLEGEGWVPNTSKPGTEKYDRLKAGEFGEVEILPPRPEPVPDEVTPVQFRRALREQGLRKQVDAYLDSLPEEDAEALRDDWDAATVIRRDDALVQQAADWMGLDGDDLDALFRLAATK